MATRCEEKVRILKTLALDIGGTSIKCAYLSQNGDKSEFRLLPEVNTPKDEAAFMMALNGLLKVAGGVDGVAISTLGVVDSTNNTILGSGAVDYLPKLNLAQTIVDNYGLPCRIMNDGKAATLGEFYFGNLTNTDSGVCLVLGSGIGGGIIYHTQLLEGHHFAAGEFSNIRTDNDWVKLNESLFYKQNSSLTLNYDHKLIQNNDGRTFFSELDQSGDLKTVLRRYCRMLAVQLYNIQLVIDPERFVIGGGISAQHVLFDYLDAAIHELASTMGDHNLFSGYMPIVVPAMHRNTANLYGAIGNYLAAELQLPVDQIQKRLAQSERVDD